MRVIERLSSHYRPAVAWSQVICLLILLLILPLLTLRADAAPVTTRRITLSNSAGAATDVTYRLEYTVATTGNVGGVVVEFCTESPIIGDTTCTAPTGFSTNEGGLALANQSGITGFTVDPATDTGTLVLARTASSISSGTNAVIEFGAGGGADGFTNPNATNTSFYARVYTYATTAAAQGYSVATPGAYVDSGGIALSTANQITITAKVQETLTFCVYTLANCAAGGTAVTLGDSNGVLSTSTQYTATNGKFDLASNAQLGVVVNMKGPLPTSGGNTLASIGTTATAGATGTEQFGLRVTSSGSPLVAAAPYNGGANNYAFDTTPAAGTFGDEIANTGGTASVSRTGTLEFVGNISNTTEAGIYVTTLTFIATGTF